MRLIGPKDENIQQLLSENIIELYNAAGRTTS
jgi:hypothetical protein